MGSPTEEAHGADQMNVSNLPATTSHPPAQSLEREDDLGNLDNQTGKSLSSPAMGKVNGPEESGAQGSVEKDSDSSVTQDFMRSTAQLSLLDEPILETQSAASLQVDGKVDKQSSQEKALPQEPDVSSKHDNEVVGQETKQEKALPQEPDSAPKLETKAPLKLADNEMADAEIQSIMEQFEDSEPQDSLPSVNTADLPPRLSSLEKVQSRSSIRSATTSLKESSADETARTSRTPSIRSLSFSRTGRYSLTEGNQPMSPLSSPSIHKALPPAPEPEPDLPFDFHRFLDQLRHRTADPVAKFLRSFLFEFGKKQWMVHEQIKIINDFLVFITSKMAQCEVWKEVSDAEFDNAKEGMEKLVMNRLYSQTFSPAIPAPVTSPTKGKRKGNEQPVGPYRRGQHQEDIERDDILAQKVRIYGWVKPEHLDIPKVEEGSRRFLKLAQQELLKIKSYRAPRDKVICVLNCCKVIFGLLKNSKSSDTSADAFIPFLIYVTLQANPEHLVSNIQYVLRFRNPDKLGGEAGYYISSLMGAIQFIENLDRTSLTISDEEFEKSVELAVSAIAEKQSEPATNTPTQSDFNKKSDLNQLGPAQTIHSPRTPTRDSSDREFDGNDEKAVIGGILKSFQRPLTNIGRMFSDEGSSTNYPVHQRSLIAGLPPETPRGLSPSMIQPPRDATDTHPSEIQTTQVSLPRKVTAEDAAAMQASAESAEAQRITRAEHKDVVDTLSGMFPNLDRDIIDDVVRMKDGRIGSAVDACLALNTGS